MLNKLDAGLAGKILLGISSLLIVFHIVNMLGVIPQNITWMGQFSSKRTLLIMGLVSIALNIAIIFCALVNNKYITDPKLQSFGEKLIPFVFYWLVGNTIANLFAKSTFEVVVFTPILLILTICMYVAKSRNTN